MIGDDDELMEIGKFILEEEEKTVETKPVTIVPIAKEFRCLTCGKPFSRKDCGKDSDGVFISIKKCPFKDCRSELVVRQKESNWAADKKYDVDPAEQIMGPRGSKYARMNAIKKRRG